MSIGMILILDFNFKIINVKHPKWWPLSGKMSMLNTQSGEHPKWWPLSGMRGQGQLI